MMPRNPLLFVFILVDPTCLVFIVTHLTPLLLLPLLFSPGGIVVVPQPKELVMHRLLLFCLPHNVTNDNGL
jgi:hypothetical protein